MARESRDFAHDLWRMSARDIIFWINNFVWTYDPRLEAKRRPFICYPFQEAALRHVGLCLGKHDVLIEKSRDMGATWLVLIQFAHRYIFFQDEAYLIVSRKEELVWKPGDPKALFSKLDLLFEMLPAWMRPVMNTRERHYQNVHNQSTIDGETTTGDVARGDRRTAIMLDEFAWFDPRTDYAALGATADARPCRIFNSTPNGAANAFYDLSKMPEMHVLRFHWTQHPAKAAGLYQSDDKGRLSIHDTTYAFPDDYPFILDGRRRSPWYDKECTRRVSAVEIAQELDIDYRGSGAQFFKNDLIDKIEAEQVNAPLLIGELDFDQVEARSPDFVERPNGQFLLWMNLGPEGKPNVETSFVVGCDVATGTEDGGGRGFSNSVLSVADAKTGEKVMEFATSGMVPDTFARLAVATCRWLNNAYLAWEANGPGGLFGKEVVRLRYANLYFRRNERRLGGTPSDVPGWHSTRETKRSMLGQYRAALGNGRFVNHSHAAVQELKQYVYTLSGGVDHSRAERSEDATGARENHGDRVIADALCSLILGEAGTGGDAYILPIFRGTARQSGGRM